MFHNFIFSAVIVYCNDNILKKYLLILEILILCFELVLILIITISICY